MERGWDGFSALYPKAPGVGFVSHTETSPTLDFHDEFVAKWRQRRLVEGFTPFVVLNINHYVIEHSLFLKFAAQRTQLSDARDSEGRVSIRRFPASVRSNEEFDVRGSGSVLAMKTGIFMQPPLQKNQIT